jgi:RNA polymerase sigma factor (sigma-70 family)
MADSDSELRTRPSLLIRIRNPRDEAAWSLFVEIYAPVVYRYCRRRGLQDYDSSDVTQEVMAQVARTVERFEYLPERGRFRDWLGTVARNKLTDYLRVAGRSPHLSGQEIASLDEVATTGADPDWGEEFNAQVYRTAVERVRVHVDAAMWRAFELTWVEGRAAAEAAEILGVPVDTVYVAKSRVLKRLREEVVALSHDSPLWRAGLCSPGGVVSSEFSRVLIPVAAP